MKQLDANRDTSAGYGQCLVCLDGILNPLKCRLQAHTARTDSGHDAHGRTSVVLWPCELRVKVDIRESTLTDDGPSDSVIVLRNAQVRWVYCSQLNHCRVCRQGRAVLNKPRRIGDGVERVVHMQR